MSPAIASSIFTIGILGLFYLDRNKNRPRFGVLWIPAIWLFLLSSRPISMWLGVSPSFSNVDATQAYVEGSPIDRTVFICLELAAMAVLLSRSTRVGSLLRRNALILFYCAFCLVSVFWSDFPLVSFKRWTKSLGDIGMVLIILSESDPLAALTRLLTRLGFLLFPLSILFIKYYPEIGRRFTNSWASEATGVAIQKNELGLICMMYGICFLWMLVAVYREREQLGRLRRFLTYGTISSMIIWLLSECRSTTSIVGFLSAGGVMWLSSRPSRKPAVVHLLVLTVLGLAVAGMFVDSSGGMVQALGKDPSLTGRKDIWSILLGLDRNSWIGTGFESFWLGRRLEFMRAALPNFPINEAHNGYLEVYLNLGWAGICFVALLLVTGYIRIISAIRRNSAEGSVLLGFYLSVIFYSFTEASFRSPSLSWLFLLLVVVGAPRAVRLADGRTRGRLCRPRPATEEKPWYAPQSVPSQPENRIPKHGPC